MQEPGFIEYLGKSVVVIGHHNADPDAVGAAQGVKELIEQLKPDTDVRVVMPDDISRLSRQIIESLELEVSETYSGSFNTVVPVDSGGLNQLGEWSEIIKTHQHVVIVIDHHTLDDELSQCTDFLVHDDQASSASELVYRLYNQYNVKPSINTAKALLAGILFDTKFFSIGSSETYKTVSVLLQSVGDLSQVMSLFQTETDVSERIARIKTAQRAEIHRVKEYVVAFSEVGSYQASGARALISLGADLAIVVGEEKTGLRASLRSTQGFFDDSGVHLGELVSDYSGVFGGSGSGHPTAAGYNGEGSYDDFKQGLLKILSERVEK
ncbi:MAG: DHH family phosphoesterase [Candidatus Bathyarchaeota archaeon]|nr:DHH family phosphoesterase [Candidatus Bathyarchaeota archaeon]